MPVHPGGAGRGGRPSAPAARLTGDDQETRDRERGPRVGRWRRCAASVAVALLIAASGMAGAAPTQPVGQPPAMEEFVPIGELTDVERLPAAGFLVAAYSIVWILAFGYFWRLSQRQSEVESELARLSRARPAPDAEDPEAG